MVEARVEVGYGPWVAVNQNTVSYSRYIHNSITCTDIHVYVYKTHEVYTPGWLISLQLWWFTSPLSLSLSLSLSNKTQNAHNIACTDSHLQMVYKNYQLLRWCVSKYLEHFSMPCDILDSYSGALLATFPYLDSLIYTATDNIRSWLVKICTGKECVWSH